MPIVLGKDHAAYLLYVDYAKPDAISHYAAADELGKIMGIALEPRAGLDSVKNDAHLHDLAKQAKKAGVPILLRFANEMNDSSAPWYKDGPEKYKAKFKIVSDVFHKEAPNVAMLWSPNDWLIGTEHQYYPGDQYVDWVGVSSYPPFLSNGQPKHGNTWIDRFRKIYDAYGSKKPIMLSEGAPIANVEYSSQNVTAQAKDELERFYASVPRRYPNVKLIVYWNNSEDYGALRHCKLTDNPPMQQSYMKAIQDPYYISDEGKSSNIYYEKVAQTTLGVGTEKISALANDPTKVTKVAYLINGKGVAEGKFPDYTANIDFSKYAGQRIDLRADFYNGANKYVTSKSVNVQVTNQAPATSSAQPPNSTKTTQTKVVPRNDIKIIVKGETVKSDAQPFIENGRTYLPIRAISESMGVKVDWNAENKLVTLTSNNGIIVFVINQDKYMVNGEPKSLDAPAKIVNGRTYLPVRAVGEALNLNVNWDGASKTVTLD